jgi:hypothetical protein
MSAQPTTTDPIAPPEDTSLATQLEAVSTALVKIDKVAAGIADLRAKYGSVVFDVATVKGMKEACEARAEIREPRYEVEKLRKAAKRPILDLGKKLDTEAERITNELLAIEGPVDQQITTEQKRKDDEKKAREEAERQRVEAIQARIDEIRQYPLDVVGASSTKIEEVIKTVVDLAVDETFAELKQQAEGAKATSLIRLRAALSKAQAMETEQARLAAERVENERIRQENEARAAAVEANQAAERRRIAEEERIAREAREKAEAEQRARMAEEERVAKATRDAEAARQAEALRLQREESDRIERERQAAREAEDRRIAAERAEAQRIEAERQALREAEEQRLADARAQLERDQEALRLAQERAAAPAPVDIPATESASVAQPIEETADPVLMTIRLTEWLPMQEVCKAAKEWAAFQHPDSKADQKRDRNLAVHARQALNNLLVAVEQLQ